MKFFCRAISFSILIPSLLMALASMNLLAGEVSFKGRLNAKEFRLAWEGSFESPKLFIARGRDDGYTFTKIDQVWRVQLAGGHSIEVRTNIIGDYNQIILREERRGKYAYFAWSESLHAPSKIFAHNLISFEDLPKENSIESAVGHGFNFRNVMWIPYTDKFIDLAKGNQKSPRYIRCEYLSKMMGTPVAQRDCLAYDRMSALMARGDISNQNCAEILIKDDLTFSGLWDRLGDFENCVRPIASFSSECLKGFLKQGRSLIRCENKLSNFSISATDALAAREYLSAKLSTYQGPSVKYYDPSLAQTYQVELRNLEFQKLSLSHCYYQFLSDSSSRAAPAEAFDSCAYSLEQSLTRPSRSLLSALSAWIVNKAFGSSHSVDESMGEGGLAYHLSERIRPTEKPQHHDLPLLGHERKDLHQHYLTYAKYLLSRGWLERELEMREREQYSSGLRAPASVSK